MDSTTPETVGKYGGSGSSGSKAQSTVGSGNTGPSNSKLGSSGSWHGAAMTGAVGGVGPTHADPILGQIVISTEVSCFSQCQC